MTTDVQVRERPILFSGPMVRAILDGRKTQTRRVISFGNSDVNGYVSKRLWDSLDWSEVYPDRGYGDAWQYLKVKAPDDALFRVRWRGDVGGHLWVRETYRMPRRLSRLTLEVTAVRVQRLQEISDTDALAEGIDGKTLGQSPRTDFWNLWNQLNAKRGYSWESNPWVWAISFRRAPSTETEEGA